MGRSPSVILLTCLTIVAASIAPARGQARKPAPDQWDQIRPLFTLVEKAAAGQSPPSDVTLRWQCDFIDADAGVVFVPFTLEIEQGHFTSFPVAMYVRVVLRGAPAPAPGPKDPLAHYPFEDASVIERLTTRRITRAFTAPPGDYDVYVALVEKATIDFPRPSTAVIKQAVTVPDLKSGFATSSIIVADRIEIDAANRRASFEEQLDEPYILWGNRITPALRRSFSAREKISVIFLVYRAGVAADDKPDVEVAYTFHRRMPGGETFFARTKPERFNAETLGPSFSLASGDLIIAGQEMPLARFPAANYRLEILVTDRTTGRTLLRSVYFTVAAGKDQ